MYTLLIDKQNEIWRRLLELYYPEGASVLDFTAGAATLHKGLPAKYRLTLCDKHEGNIVRDLITDSYEDLGQHDAAVFDPPCLVRRLSFDYPLRDKGTARGQWRSRRLERHVTNQSVSQFNDRLEALNIKAPSILKPQGLLFCKVMDVRFKDELVPHHFEVWKRLANFRLVDHGVYLRQGATTWGSKRHLQNLHGHWMVFRRL
jgi:hypothetical protein